MAARKRAETGAGYVYAIHAVGTESVKIGTANRPESRLRELQVGCPHELRIIATAQGGMPFERILHKFLRKARVRGEWYSMTHPSTESILDYMRQGKGYSEWLLSGMKQRRLWWQLKDLNDILYSLENMNGRKEGNENPKPLSIQSA